MSMNKELADEVCKNLGQAIVSCVRASAQLPSASDHEYYRTFSQFRSAMTGDKAGHGGAGRRVMGIMDKIISGLNGPGAPAARLSKMDADEAFEKAGDFVDERLEVVDSLIDVMLGRSSGVKTAGMAADKAAQQGRWKSKKVRGTPQDLDLAKPQLKFTIPVDNSDTPFTPLIWPKIHAAPHGAQSHSKHPYASEIASIDYQPHMLAAPPGQPQEPLSMEATPFIWVDTLEALGAARQHLEGCTEIAVDLEHHSVRSFQGITCLMQVSSRERDYIIDAIQLRGHMHLLLGVFTDPTVTKVFHGADSDVKWLQRDFGLYIVNLFDTGQASRELGLPSFSFAYLLETICGQEADKQYQLADWRVRPLPAELLKYARSDTHYLLWIYDSLRQTLAKRGEGAIRGVLERSEAVSLVEYEKDMFNPTGAASLLARSGKATDAACFSRLYRWRDGIARERDESTFYVLPNNLMFRLAQTMPRDADAVVEACRPTVPPLVRELASQLADMIGNKGEEGGAEEGGMQASVDAVPGQGEVYEQAVVFEDDLAMQNVPVVKAPKVTVAKENAGGGWGGAGSPYAEPAVEVKASGKGAEAQAKVRTAIQSLSLLPALRGFSVSGMAKRAEEEEEVVVEVVAPAAPGVYEEAQVKEEEEGPKRMRDMFEKSEGGGKAGKKHKASRGGAREEEEGDKYMTSEARAAAADQATFMKAIGEDHRHEGPAPRGEGDFRPFDYAVNSPAAQGAPAAKAPKIPQFDPHEGTSYGKKTNAPSRAGKMHSKSTTYSSRGGGKGGGGGRGGKR